jgi:hypothetical protein
MLHIDLDQDTRSAAKRSESGECFIGEQRVPAHDAIVFDGRYYRYKSYRYDLLSDARDYAQLDVTRSESSVVVGDYGNWTEAEQPTEAERQTMADLSISFDGKYYRYEEYRYDQFSAAINYAQLMQRIRP